MIKCFSHSCEQIHVIFSEEKKILSEIFVVYWHQFKLNLIEIRRTAKPIYRNIQRHTMFERKLEKKNSFHARLDMSFVKILFIHFSFDADWPSRERIHGFNKSRYKANWSGWTRHDHIWYDLILFTSKLSDIIVMWDFNFARSKKLRLVWIEWKREKKSEI